MIKQELINRYQAWLQSDFLPEEEGYRGWIDQAEWDGHFNRLSTMFANFVLVRQLPEEPQQIVDAYGHYVTAVLKERSLESGEAPAQVQQEHQYYHWPVCLFAASDGFREAG